MYSLDGPLTDGSGVNVRYSKIAMRRLPAGVKAPDNVAWYTNDLVGGNLAIPESMLSVLPRQ